MTRKHFNAIAAAIKWETQTENLDKLEAIESVARALATELSAFNSNFDKGRFITACGF